MKDGKPVTTQEGLRNILGQHGFKELQAPEDVRFVIKENPWVYQYTLANVTFWQKLWFLDKDYYSFKLLIFILYFLLNSKWTKKIDRNYYISFLLESQMFMYFFIFLSRFILSNWLFKLWTR